MNVYSLRQATQDDLFFLFNVSTKAMLPVRKVRNPNLKIDVDEEFKKYSEEFDPEKIQVIQWNNKDVGRLRVVRSEKEIFIGGIQILPEFQKKGIGTALLQDLIDEANESGIPVSLRVSGLNEFV